MALWSSGVTWNSGILWSPAAPPSGGPYQNHKPKHPSMKRDKFYPGRVAERSDWHTNLAAKLPIHGPTLDLTLAQINNGVADNLTLAYGYGDWKTNLYEMGPAGTAALDELASGTGGDPFVFPTYTAPTPPTLPVGITAVLPGALERTFLLIQEMKAKPGYTLPIGLDMGIVGSEAPPPPPPGEVPPPDITVTVISGTTNQNGRVKFVKNGHDYVIIECSINGGAYASLGMSNKSPFIDTRALLVAGQAEVREYRGRYFDNGAPSSGWSDVATVTVGP